MAPLLSRFRSVLMRPLRVSQPLRFPYGARADELRLRCHLWRCYRTLWCPCQSFKNAIKDVEVSDTEHPGHPVRVFKEENLALRAALIRIRRLLDTYELMEDEEMLAEMRKGLVRQMGLVGQFDIHYQRKEELFFLSWSAMDTIHLLKLCGEWMIRLGNSFKQL